MNIPIITEREIDCVRVVEITIPESYCFWESYGGKRFVQCLFRNLKPAGLDVDMDGKPFPEIEEVYAYIFEESDLDIDSIVYRRQDFDESSTAMYSIRCGGQFSAWSGHCMAYHGEVLEPIRYDRGLYLASLSLPEKTKSGDNIIRRRKRIQHKKTGRWGTSLNERGVFTLYAERAGLRMR